MQEIPVTKNRLLVFETMFEHSNFMNIKNFGKKTVHFSAPHIVKEFEISLENDLSNSNKVK